MQYQTRKETAEATVHDAADDRLGSAQPDNDPISSASASTGVVPAELIAAEQRPVEVRPTVALPIETQAVDFMTPDGRPREFRPREVIPAEGR